MGRGRSRKGGSRGYRPMHNRTPPLSYSPYSSSSVSLSPSCLPFSAVPELGLVIGTELELLPPPLPSHPLPPLLLRLFRRQWRQQQARCPLCGHFENYFDGSVDFAGFGVCVSRPASLSTRPNPRCCSRRLPFRCQCRTKTIEIEIAKIVMETEMWTVGTSRAR